MPSVSPTERTRLQEGICNPQHDGQVNYAAPRKPFRLLVPLLMASALFAAAACISRNMPFPEGSAKTGGSKNAMSMPSGMSTPAVRSAEDPDSTRTQLCAVPLDRYVMQGADLVAYFSLEANDDAVMGTEEHSSVYQTYTFLFSSSENKGLFEEQPSRYLPKWGGFCSWGIAQEDNWTKYNLGPPSDPKSWLITPEGELFFFRSDWNKVLFVEDIEGYSRIGDRIWSHWFGGGVPSSTNSYSPINSSCFCREVDGFVETCVCPGKLGC